MATYKIKKKIADNGTTEEILLPISSIDGLQTALDGKQASGSYATTTQVNAKYTKPSAGIPKSDLASAVQTSLGKADTAIQTESDPTVPTWAKASSKPTYTASEVGAVPTTRKVNGKALNTDITLSASDVGALSSSGGNVSGHIYLTGAKESSSTGNTSQIVFGTSSNNHVAVSSNTNALVINPTTSTTTNQIVLYLDKASVFPNGISGNASSATTAANATKLNGKEASYYAKASDIPAVPTFNFSNGVLTITT